MLIIQSLSIDGKTLTVTAAIREVISSKVDLASDTPVPTMVLEIDFGNGDPMVPMGITQALLAGLSAPAQNFLGVAQTSWHKIPEGIENITITSSEVVVDDGKAVYNKYTGLLVVVNPFHMYRLRDPSQE